MTKKVTLNIAEKRGRQRVNIVKPERDIERKKDGLVPSTPGGPLGEPLDCKPQEEGPWREVNSCSEDQMFETPYGVLLDPDPGGIGALMTELYHFTWEVGEEYIDGDQMMVRVFDDLHGWVGNFSSGDTGAGALIPVTSGDAWLIVGDVRGFGSAWPCAGDHEHNNVSWGIRFFNSSFGTISTHTIGVHSGPGGDLATEWFDNDQLTVTVPATATWAMLTQATDPSLGCQNGATSIDNVTITAIDYHPIEPASILPMLGKQITANGCRQSSTEYSVALNPSEVLEVRIDGLVMPPATWTFVEPKSVVFASPVDQDAVVWILYVA